MKKVILLMSILAFTAGVAFADAECRPNLFYIGKSDNANVIYYDANVTKDGKFDSKNPVIIYWLMYAQKGQREDMTRLERPHFGINTKELEAGLRWQVNIRQAMLANKDMILSFKDGCPVIVADVGGVESYMLSAFIQIDPNSGLLPSVQWIDINGISVADGAKTTERIIRK